MLEPPAVCSRRSVGLVGGVELVDGTDGVEGAREADVRQAVDHCGRLDLDAVAGLQVALHMPAELHVGAADCRQQASNVVVSIPPSRKLRRAMEVAFTRRYGIGVEFVSARSSASIQKMISEAKAGIQYVDLHIGGTEPAVTMLLAEKALEPVEPYFVLPEVKDPKRWWGGRHIWVDNDKRFIYPFAAHQIVSLWCNPSEYKPAEFQSFDDLLNPKLQGKIGISDPRRPGSAIRCGRTCFRSKAEDYLKKLVAQKLFVARDLRLLGENLSSGENRRHLGHRLFRAAAVYQGRLAGRAAPLSEGGPLHHRR